MDGTIMFKNFLIKSLFIILFTLYNLQAHAIQWSNAPLACLPSRAEKWKNTDTVPLCHCPPQSYCPSEKNLKPSDVEFIVEWHWSDGTKESGTLSGTDIPELKNGHIKIKDIFKYTPEQIKKIVSVPVLKKFGVNTVVNDKNLAVYVKDTTTTILLKEGSALEGWLNDTMKLPLDLASRCCESACPDGLVPTYKNTQVVDPNAVLETKYTMTKMEHDDYKTDFKYAYKKIFGLLYLLNANYNNKINSLSAFYQTQTSTPNLENYLNNVNSFISEIEPSKNLFPINQYNLLINKFSALQTTLQDELNRRNAPPKYVTVQSVTCSTSVSYSREGCLHKGTKITMADGTFKTIEELKLGDEVKGNHGAAKIIALSKFTQKEDRMYSINGGKAFFTVEHPVLTPQGWKSIDSTITSVKSNAKIIGTLRVGDIILMDGGKQLKVTSIKEELMQGGIDAYNLSVTGDGSFIANGFIMKSFKQMQMHY